MDNKQVHTHSRQNRDLPKSQSRNTRRAEAIAEDIPNLSSKKKPWLGFLVLATSILVAAAIPFLPAKSDVVNSQQAKARTVQFNNSGAVGLELVSDNQLSLALESSGFSDAEKTQLRQQVQKGSVKLTWLTLWDDMAEDGDVLSVSSQGYSLTVPILHKKATVVLPYPSNGFLEVAGVIDGGGGITVAIMSPQGSVFLPPMAVGQSIRVPVYVP